MLIRILRPDIIHSLELQNAGYLVLQAKARLGKSFPTWIATNWEVTYIFLVDWQHTETGLGLF